MFTTELKVDVSKALKKLDKISNFQPIVLPEMKISAAKIVGILKERTPASVSYYDRFSGLLRRSWTAIFSSEGAAGKVKVQFKNTDPRASWLLKYLIKGTHAHTIKAKNASALMIPLQAGNIVFAPMVRHPGTRPVRTLTELDGKEISAEISNMKTRIRAALKKAAADR